jgi:hypothetical protein
MLFATVERVAQEKVAAAYEEGLQLVNNCVEDARKTMADTSLQMQERVRGLDIASQELDVLKEKAATGATAGTRVAIAAARAALADKQQGLKTLQTLCDSGQVAADFVSDAIVKQGDSVREAQNEVALLEAAAARAEELVGQRTAAEAAVSAAKSAIEESRALLETVKAEVADLDIRLESFRYWGAHIKAGPRPLVPIDDEEDSDQEEEPESVEHQDGQKEEDQVREHSITVRTRAVGESDDEQRHGSPES